LKQDLTVHFGGRPTVDDISVAIIDCARGARALTE